MSEKISIFDVTSSFPFLREQSNINYLTPSDRGDLSGLGDSNIVIGNLEDLDREVFFKLKENKKTLESVLASGLGIFFCTESDSLDPYTVTIPEIGMFLENIRLLPGRTIYSVGDIEIVKKLEKSGYFDKYSTILETKGTSISYDNKNDRFYGGNTMSGRKFKVRCEPLLKTTANENVGLHIRYYAGEIFLFPDVSKKNEVLMEIIPKPEHQLDKEKPSFIENIMVYPQTALAEQISIKKKGIDELELAVSEMEKDFSDFNVWKDLLWQTDKQLEKVVQKFFALVFGISLENYLTEDGEEIDLVGEYDGKKIIVEVKGKTKCINLKEDVRQAIDRSTQFEEEWSSPKVLLVGNPYRLNELDERPPSVSEELVSAHAVKKAKSNGIGIILSTDIFQIIQDELSKKISEEEKGQILKEILGANGLYKYSKK